MKTIAIETDGLNEKEIGDISKLFDLLAMNGGGVEAVDAIILRVADDLAPAIGRVAQAVSAPWYPVLSEQEIAAPQPAPAETEKKRTLKPGTRKCRVCGDLLKSVRSDSNYCEKRECRRVRDREYTARRLGEEFVDAQPGEPEHAEDGKSAWVIEEGPRAGEKLSSVEMSMALRMRSIDPGTHVRSSKRGRHVVFAEPGSKGLKMRQVQLDGAPHNISIP
jgi:hypothetical protein